jgi:hypothetical protein
MWPSLRLSGASASASYGGQSSHCALKLFVISLSDGEANPFDKLRINSAPGEDWWAVQDSNLRPPVCKTDALPTELTAPNFRLKNCRRKEGESQSSLYNFLKFNTLL